MSTADKEDFPNWTKAAALNQRLDTALLLDAFLQTLFDMQTRYKKGEESP